MMNYLRRIRDRILGRLGTREYRNLGAKIGRNVHLGPGVRLDPSHCWLIEIGDSVTLAPDVLVLAHDASIHSRIGYSRIANTTIEDGVFIGARSTILPGVTIGSGAIVGAGAVVAKDVAPGTLVVGNPARFVRTVDDLIADHSARLRERPAFCREGWSVGSISERRKNEQSERLGRLGGYLE